MAEKNATAAPAQVKNQDAQVGVNDPDLLKSVFPNILDNYDLPQYTLKLSIKKGNDPGATEERIIAQTSVTATQIDDLTINTLSSGQAAGEVTFRLTQPGHATLLDDMNRFRREMGLELSVRPIVYLEINFKGYSTSDDNETSAPVNIAGPYVYKLFIADVDVTINEEGSEYAVKAIVHSHYAVINSVAEIPVLTVNKGSTLRECCENLRLSLKEYYLKEKPQYHWQDQYFFDLEDKSLFIDGTNIADTNLDESALDSNNQDLTGAGSEERSKIEGGEGIEVTGGEIHIRSGIKMEQFFLVMLSMNEVFKKHIARRENSDPKAAPKPEQTFVKWFRVLTDVEEGRFDQYRSEYSRKFKYKLKVLETARTDIGAPDEKPDENQVINRFKEIKDRGLLRKAYYYIFTGKNDQIQNLDLNFSAGAVVFNPPGRDFGNPKEALAAQLSNVPSDMGDDERELYEKIIKARSDVITSDKQETAWIGDTDYQDASDELVELVREYETKYGKEFGIYADVNTTKALEKAKPLDRHYVQSLNSPDHVQAGTYFGFSNTLFGFTAYQYHVAALGSSLVRLDLTVRGDPWYLGKRVWPKSATGSDKSVYAEYLLEKRKKDDEDVYQIHATPTEGCFYDDHTYFYLQFLSPRIDLNDYTDEDDDDGYWKFESKDGVLLQSFSGIYLIQSVTNKFTNGQFSSQIDGQLLSELMVDKVKEEMDKEKSK